MRINWEKNHHPIYTSKEKRNRINLIIITDLVCISISSSSYWQTPIVRNFYPEPQGVRLKMLQSNRLHVFQYLESLTNGVVIPAEEPHHLI